MTATFVIETMACVNALKRETHQRRQKVHCCLFTVSPTSNFVNDLPCSLWYCTKLQSFKIKRLPLNLSFQHILCFRKRSVLYYSAFVCSCSICSTKLFNSWIKL